PIPSLGPTEVLIRVKVASICGTDVHIYDWDAWAQARIKVPLVQGHEFSGYVEKVGSDVKGLKRGDYVSAEGHVADGTCYMCRAMGAGRVLAIGHRNEYRMKLAKTVGAHAVLKSDKGLVDEVMDLTSGEGVYEVLEFSGSEQVLAQALSIVRPAGGIHILGLYAKPVTFDLSEMVTKGVSMYGIHGRLMYKTWYQMGGLLRSGNLNLRPKIGRASCRE